MFVHEHVDCRQSFCGDGVLHNQREECDGLDIGHHACATYKPGRVLLLYFLYYGLICVINRPLKPRSIHFRPYLHTCHYCHFNPFTY